MTTKEIAQAHKLLADIPNRVKWGLSPAERKVLDKIIATLPKSTVK